MLKEVKTLYWTHGRARRGIIVLTEESIIVYHGPKGASAHHEKLRDFVFTSFPLDGITNLRFEMAFIRGKKLTFFLDDDAYSSAHDKMPHDMRFNRNDENIIFFEVNNDAAGEIADFVEQARIYMKKHIVF